MIISGKKVTFPPEITEAEFEKTIKSKLNSITENYVPNSGLYKDQKITPKQLDTLKYKELINKIDINKKQLT